MSNGAGEKSDGNSNRNNGSRREGNAMPPPQSPNSAHHKHTQTDGVWQYTRPDAEVDTATKAAVKLLLTLYISNLKQR